MLGVGRGKLAPTAPRGACVVNAAATAATIIQVVSNSDKTDDGTPAASDQLTGNCNWLRRWSRHHYEYTRKARHINTTLEKNLACPKWYGCLWCVPG